MTDTTLHPPPFRAYDAPRRPGWFTRTETWLDERGKGAWIAAMVLGFVFVWPVGLAILAYMIWSKRMFNRSCAHRGHHSHHSRPHFSRATFRTSGNSAFDAYKSETLRRLEEEQESFENFLNRLRDAKDKSEFDQFMDDRATKSDRPDGDSAPEPSN